MIAIRSLSPEQRKAHSFLVVGEATCPFCKRTDVRVLNDQGHRGYDYFEKHGPRGSDDTGRCEGSEKMLANL